MFTIKLRRFAGITAVAALCLPQALTAQTRCGTIADEVERLACYDAAARRPQAQRAPDDEGPSAPPAERYSILAHRPSYLLPLTYTEDAGRILEVGEPIQEESLQKVEVKFQYSFKLPVLDEILFDGDLLHFAFTQRSLWQAYNRDLSSPFRETVYEPELIWSIPLSRPLFGDRLSHVALGINHQSNGRGGSLSRSWNRITLETAWTDPDWSVGLRLWHRIPESQDNDDNPDIASYLGYGDLRLNYRWGQYQFSSVLQNNLRSHDNHTTAELGVSWPFTGKLRGYAQFFTGYGETLIDYDQRVTRFGVGVMLSN